MKPVYKFLLSQVGVNMPNPRLVNVELLGIGTFLLCLAATIIFYLLLGRWKAVFYSLLHWIITLIIVIVGAFFFAAKMWPRGGSKALILGGVNGFIALLLFIGLSLLARRFSIFAKATPF
ncbi:hypothetical protein [Dyadobacter bucti]|uniref:hypothetical protein n=1 Tax=Dyadobacter bucti TaxID=2572203 RepID=UPI0011083C2B|nr:hypothetical protein [Dyadobacter bucti]